MQAREKDNCKDNSEDGQEQLHYMCHRVYLLVWKGLCSCMRAVRSRHSTSSAQYTMLEP